MSDPMTPEAIAAVLLDRFPDVYAKQTWGETSFFYNPGRRLAHGTYFATLKTADGPNDRASALNRPGVYRLNFGLPKAAYRALFGPPPPRPGKGLSIEGPWDFAALDLLTPHPVYGWMGWVAILTPTPVTFDRLFPLIGDAHEKAKMTLARRQR